MAQSLWDILPKTVHDNIYTYDNTYREQMIPTLNELWRTSWIRYLNSNINSPTSELSEDIRDIITTFIKYFVQYSKLENMYPDTGFLDYHIIHNRIYGIFELRVFYDDENIFRGTVIRNDLTEDEDTFMFYERELMLIHVDDDTGYSLYLRI